MDTESIIAEAETFFNVESTYFDDKLMAYHPTSVPTIVAFCCKINMSKKKLLALAKEDEALQEALDMANTHIERILTDQALCGMTPQTVSVKALQNLSGWDKTADVAGEEPDIDESQIKSAKDAVLASYVK